MIHMATTISLLIISNTDTKEYAKGLLVSHQNGSTADSKQLLIEYGILSQVYDTLRLE